MGMPDDEIVTARMLNQRISELLQGTVTFGEFDAWLAGSTWEDSDVSPDTLPLVRSIQLVFAEFSSGHRTWPGVRRYLSEIAKWVNIQVSWGGTLSTTTTGTTAVNRQVTVTADPSSGTNIRLAVVSV